MMMSTPSNPTPQAKALQSVSATAPINWNSLTMSPSSTQPLKNQTVIHPDGTKVTHTYDTEAKPLPSPQQGKPTPPPTPQSGVLAPQSSTPPSPLATYSTPANPSVGVLAQTAAQGSPTGQQYTQDTAKASAPTGTQTGLLNTLQNVGQGNTAIGQKAADIGSQFQKEIQDTKQGFGNIQTGDLSTGTSPVAEGNAGLAYNNMSNRLSALAEGEDAALKGTGQQLTGQQQYADAVNNALSGANTQQSQQITGLNQAAGQANTAQSNMQTGLNNAGNLAKPEAVPYNTQYISPATGQPVGGGAGGQLPADAQNAVNSYAQQVKNGQMTRADAESRLSAYGVAGTNALNSALGQNFNTNASNASAQTTAQGQQIQTAAASTNAALDTLASAFKNLNPLQTNGIPLTNSIANWIGQNLGESALSQYKTNLADARSQLIGVLNSSGGTPTGNEATALQYLPDNMTKEQFDKNVGTAQNPGIVRQLVKQKVDAFTNSGQQPSQNQPQASSTGGSNSLFNW